MSKDTRTTAEIYNDTFQYFQKRTALKNCSTSQLIDWINRQLNSFKWSNHDEAVLIEIINRLEEK